MYFVVKITCTKGRWRKAGSELCAIPMSECLVLSKSAIYAEKVDVSSIDGRRWRWNFVANESEARRFRGEGGIVMRNGV